MTSSDDKGADVGPVFEATLMRFVDGDLPPREHAFVARLIAAHPDATRSALAYRFTNEELRRAYDVAMNVPAELINRCLPAADRPSLRSRRPGWRPTLLALAASLALLLAGAAGWLLREATQSNAAVFLGIAPLTHAKKERVTTPDWRTKIWNR
jgi:anti-sigma factor RsiW